MADTLVIAEPGCTHEGDYASVVRLIQTAAYCGANVFKPQWVSDPIQMCERRHIGPDHPKRAFYERAYGWLNFPVEWHPYFSALAHQLGMQYACSVFLPQDVATLAPFLDYLKVANFEAEDESLIRACRLFQGPHEKTLLVSHPGGGSSWASRYWWAPTKHLHCVAAYPAPVEAVNLRCLRRVYDEWGEIEQWGFDGYSDHTGNVLTGALAVACGAQIVEAHYRLDDCAPGNPDYAVAFTPQEFTQYVQNIRDAEIMLGDGNKRLQECEQWAIPYRVTA